VNQEDGYTSNAVVLVVGGAQEAFNARPGCYKICIKNRKGFVKVALETGATLVPVISFGEVDVYDQPENGKGTRLRKFQDMYKRWTGIAPAIFIGRGFFQYSFGIIPRRSPIHTVVGAPIDVEKILTPSKEDVEKLHAKFMVELEKLFNEHKSKYLENPDEVQLVME
jgi:2-acylglycerol O-acyltransferase 2